MTFELLAPAKLTLSLRVLGARADGFHDLEALTVSISAPGDTLWVSPGPPGVQLQVSGPASAGVPAGAENLVERAASAVMPAHEGIEVRLRKQIPAGAGLGGGSSDAAAVLRFCAGTYGLSADAVEQAAAALGSDVPFCLQGGPAWMRGRGELIEGLTLPEAVRVLVVVPPFSISTPAVYGAWDELGGPQGERTVDPPHALAHLVEVLRNDLEPAAEHVEPRLRPFREAFEAAAGATALLAGSGSACWIPFEDPEAGRQAANRVESTLGVTAFLGLSLPAGPGGG